MVLQKAAKETKDGIGRSFLTTDFTDCTDIGADPPTKADLPRDSGPLLLGPWPNPECGFCRPGHFPEKHRAPETLSRNLVRDRFLR
jgi:hypothetical protein